jgi:hypothetical protein
MASSIDDITSLGDDVFGLSITEPKLAALIASRSASNDVASISPVTCIESLRKEPFIPCAAPLINVGGAENDNIEVSFLTVKY